MTASSIVAPQTAPTRLTHLHDRPREGGVDPTYGTVTWKTLISDTLTDSRDLMLGVADFEPGGTLNPHRHEAAEFYFCLSGSGEVTLDGVAHWMQPGSALFIPSNAEHGVVAGPEGMSFAYGFARNNINEVEYVFSAPMAAAAE